MALLPIRIVAARWRHVRSVLDGLSPHEKSQHFDVEQWGIQTDCGTVACVAGHASLNPWFRKRGFAAEFKPTIIGTVLTPINHTESWGSMIEAFFVGREDYWVIDHDPVLRKRHRLYQSGLAVFYGDKGKRVDTIIRHIDKFLARLEAERVKKA